MTSEQRLHELEKHIADVRARLPKHSVPAAMILELEDLEDERDRLLRFLESNSSTPPAQTQPR